MRKGQCAAESARGFAGDLLEATGEIKLVAEAEALSDLAIR